MRRANWRLYHYRLTIHDAGPIPNVVISPGITNLLKSVIAPETPSSELQIRQAEQGAIAKVRDILRSAKPLRACGSIPKTISQWESKWNPNRSPIPAAWSC